MTRKRLLIIPALILAALAVAGIVYVMTFHPPSDRYPVRGIDVSHHQGAIDWTGVASDGIRFAWIKATEGGDFSDTRFTENWRRAEAAGLLRGAYHFFTLCRPGTEQAAHFIATVPLDETALPPAVDLEFTGNCAEKDHLPDIPGELAAFLERIESHYGRTAVVYVRPDFYAAHLTGRNIRNPLWLQSFVREPDYGERPWTFWQYHVFGQVRGIDVPVDRNVFRGTEADFTAWLESNGATR